MDLPVDCKKYAFTTGIVIGLTETSYRRRYCYPSHFDAVEAYEKMETTKSDPSGNWVKVKGVSDTGEWLDDLNPNMKD